jgi:sulfotransferase family protein
MPLDVIGPGFGRTGTNSLKLALEQLGFGPCHHMYEVRDNPELLADWQAAGNGEEMDWQKVFRNYRAQVDWPGAHYWRELIAAFPKAKVVLSVREPNGWFDSVQATIAPFVAARGKHDNAHANAIAEMCHHALIQPTFGDGFSDRTHAIDVFERHNEEVKTAVPADNLLVFDVRQGWAPLCAFLGAEVPDTDFPRTNSSKEFGEENWNQK